MSDSTDDRAEDEYVPPGIDVSRPDVARMYDYMLGGTFNYHIDRVAAEKVFQNDPETQNAVWANRGFLTRVSEWIAKQGVDQFLDLGSGLPTMNNVHEVVHRVNPDARVIYCDNSDGIVYQSLSLIGNVDRVHYIEGDIRQPSSILESDTVRTYLDFSRPIGLLFIGVVYFIADPRDAVAELIDAMPDGSYVAWGHATSDRQDASVLQRADEIYTNTTENLFLRTKQEIEQIFASTERSTLEMVPPYDGAEPGMCWIGQWGADDPVAADDEGGRWNYAGVARKVARQA